MLKKFVEIKEAVLHLIFPNLCLQCDEELLRNQKMICHFCVDELHYTNYENTNEKTALDKVFWGRCNFEFTYALLWFDKENSTQKILHEIKYKNKQKFAHLMGKKIGEHAHKIFLMSKIDALIPIPLHPKKEFTRGYNQSELIANGIAETINLKVEKDLISREKHAESLTKKGRFQRWETIDNTFFVNPNFQHYKHIVLVDDVITTGATIERIYQELKNAYPKLKISVVSLAFTQTN